MNVICSGNGIGDAVCSLYAIESVVKSGYSDKIHFYTKHIQWFEDVVSANIHPYREALRIKQGYNTYTEDNESFERFGKTYRKQVYLKNLNMNGTSKPEQPTMKRYWTLTNSKEIIICPTASYSNRVWDKSNFVSLSAELIKMGFPVTIIGLGSEREYADFKGCNMMISKTPKDAIERLLKCYCFIGNDSGIAHVASMYKVPTFIIMDEHLGFNHVFSHTESVKNVKEAKSLSDISVEDVRKSVFSENDGYIKGDYSFTIVGGINKGDGLGKVCYTTVKGIMKKKGLVYNTSYFGSADVSDAVTQNMADRNNYSVGKKSLITNWTGGIPFPIYQLSDAYEICMFEAEKKMPENWIERWNKYCKGVIVPDEWNKSNFIECGVTIPIHVVPLIVETDTITQNTFGNDIFTFGITSQYEERKNHELAIKAFLKKFGDSKDHKLKVHGRWGHLYPKLIKKYGKYKNVEILCGVLTESEMDIWWKSLDCYVLCSAGEGFSYTPREAAIRCIPTIVSDCTSHKVLVATNGVYGVKPSGTKSSYKHIWDSYCGVDYTFSVNSLANAMGEVRNCFDEWRERIKLTNDYIRKNENIDIVTDQLLEILK